MPKIEDCKQITGNELSYAEKKQKVNYDFLDLLKFILSVCVVSIHSQFIPNILKPWTRLAVPIFFMISSYLFFDKLKNVENYKNKNDILKKYIKRNLILYLFYFILLIPITLYVRQWFDNGVVFGIIFFIRSFLFGSTFIASWFIIASVEAITIVFLLSKKINTKILLIISLVINLFCCMASNYGDLMENINFIDNFYSVYQNIFLEPYNGWPVAILWTAVGKLFAEKKLEIKNARIYLLISMILLYVEYKIINLIGCSYTDDCYVFLIPTGFLIFYLSLKCDTIHIKNSMFFRKTSTIIYAVHGSLIPVLSIILERTINVSNNNIIVTVQDFSLQGHKTHCLQRH